MGKTINERARDIVCEMATDTMFFNEQVNMCKRMAEEQRAIDTSEDNVMTIYNFVVDWKNGKFGIRPLSECLKEHLKLED